MGTGCSTAGRSTGEQVQPYSHTQKVIKKAEKESLFLKPVDRTRILDIGNHLFEVIKS